MRLEDFEALPAPGSLSWLPVRQGRAVGPRRDRLAQARGLVTAPE